MKYKMDNVKCGKELRRGSYTSHLKVCLRKPKLPEDDEEEPPLRLYLTNDYTFIGFYTQRIFKRAICKIIFYIVLVYRDNGRTNNNTSIKEGNEKVLLQEPKQDNRELKRLLQNKQRKDIRR